MTMDANELARLRAVAEAATPGPWEDYDIYQMVCPTQIDGYAYPTDRAIAQAHTEADHRHIAAFDPPTVLALLAEVEQLRGEVANVDEVIGALQVDHDAELRELEDENTELKLERDGLRRRLAKVRFRVEGGSFYMAREIFEIVTESRA